MKITFRRQGFSAPNLHLLENAQLVIDAYQEKGIRMTLRQLYYQLVAAAVIPNNNQAYTQLTNLITNARYAGLVDWDAIEDNLRKPKLPSTFADLEELLLAAHQSYKLNWWDDMDTYVELYTEKDALSSILGPLAREHRIPFQVNRGYASASSMFEASQRFLAHDDKELVILYLGDHDPSGLDMVRDIEKRLEEFGVEVKVEHIALTWEQIERYNPPPNPAKITDSRASNYIEKYGESSWEVDALPPDVMMELVNSSILQYCDDDIKSEVEKREEKDLEKLDRFRRKLRKDE